MLAFSKYHGLGNDFLIVDLRDGDTSPSVQDGHIVRALCDRRFGCGADGVLAILPSRVADADFRMRVLNADGSEAEMCGNGIRCVAKHFYQTDPALKKQTLRIDTGAGVLACRLVANDDGDVQSVSVDMGPARLGAEQIPMTGASVDGKERCINIPLPLSDRELAVTGVSMGNPHAVAFVEQTGPNLRTLAETVGPSVETHRMFPQKTNAEFAHVRSPVEIELVVWERGVGITLACGTGACATAAAACLTGHSKTDTDITVHLPGGPLVIRVTPDYSNVNMRGPAQHVYDAQVDLAKLAG